MVDISKLQKKAALVRKWCLVSTTNAGSGHPTSCLSAADLMTVLFNNYFQYNIANSAEPLNDRLIFSKGHAAPLLYSLFALSGAFDLKELLTLRKFGSRLEGHPTPEFPYAEVATGSLGQGLSIGAGMAYGSQKSEVRSQKSPRVYVLLGDGEMAEGSIWEAANFASYYSLNNLIAIVDVNRFGQSQETMFGDKVEEYTDRFSAFGWETIVIDGHNFKDIEKAFHSAVSKTSSKPFAIIAKTKKGKGVSFLEDQDGWHGKALKKEELERALKELGEVDEDLRFSLRLPIQKTQNTQSVGKSDWSDSQKVRRAGSSEFSEYSEKYKLGNEIATREVYGEVLAKIADKNPLIYALDGDVKNSTFAQEFKKAHPARFIECFIAEQNMVGVALGLSKREKIPFISTFAAFLTRAFDQIRMAAQSRANIKFVGSHAGVSIGEDGSSQMGLEDIAMFGTIPDSVIFHPCDSVSTVKILPLMLEHSGISYLRTLRPKTPVIYGEDEEFKIGGSKILRSSKSDLLTIVAAGITVHEALKAYELLKKEGILVRVVDAYSIKPLDFETLKQCINETMKQWIITVEDHYEHGGLGDFVLSALSSTGEHVEKMAVSKIPRSGTKDELLDDVGISARDIAQKVKLFL
ncbi:MAG: transketolase [Candidatus Levybacteria bacterium]|nr:transketolase [Candidatus Levybacteria bacterium]MBI3093058.1 transketolase [Candidatus Levybacteria bacterium]